MFKQMLDKARAKVLSTSSATRIASARIEGLEDRCLMHGGFGGFGLGFAGGGGGGFPSAFGDPGLHAGRTIQFSQAPAAVQSGLKSLASTDNVTVPTDTITVILDNFNGVETYSINLTGTGTETRLTVDQSGKPVTAATRSSTTFGAITTKAVTDELTALASALSLTAPTSTTPVEVITASDGTVTYVAALGSSSTTTTTNNDASDGFWEHHGEVISVDASGNPVGFEQVPLSTLSTAIQNGLKSNAPSGATALTSTSLIDVRTLSGVTTYTATYTSSGTTTTVTVDKAGKLTSLPSSTTVEFSTLPQVAQAELQTLATADGVAGTISSTQTVTAYDEANGTTIYSVTLAATNSSTGTTQTYNITLSVDQAGNPTVPPFGARFGGGFGFGGGGCDGAGGGGGDDDNGGTTGTTSGGTTTTTTTTNTPALTAADQSSTNSTTTTTGKKHKKGHAARHHHKHHANNGTTTTTTAT
jgi:hypothetical protein